MSPIFRRIIHASLPGSALYWQSGANHRFGRQEKDSAMKADKRSSRTGSLRRPKDCRVSDLGLTGFAECRISGPNPCPYAVPFGYGFLCKHPELKTIIANSREGQLAPALR